MRVISLALAAVVLSATAVSAQSMNPMRGEIKSLTDQFALRVHPGNPYMHRIKVEVRVYDDTFREVQAQVMPREAMLAPQDTRTFMVMVPFDGKTERKVRVCAESVPFLNRPERLRTQVCGRFIARRM